MDSVVEEGDEVRTQSGDVVQGNGGGAIWVESKDVVLGWWQEILL